MSNTSVILVTGSTTGFGRLTVETLARQGHRVFAAMRESTGKNARACKELQTLAEKTRLALQIVDLDVTDDASVRQAIEYVVRTANRLDVIVNNAGVSYTGPIEAFTLEQVQQQFDTNVFGVIRVNRAALPQMRAQASGLLLQVGSVLGRANGGKGSLLISGEVRGETPLSWAGAVILPGETPWEPANLSEKKGLTFCVKGDGKTYRLMIFAGRMGKASPPTIIPFVADGRWQPISVDFSQQRYQIDTQALLGVAFVAVPPAGQFVFQIAQVRFV